MERFPTAAHLASWAGMPPGNNESAGKRKSGKATKGNKHIRTTLVEAARAAARTKNTCLSAQYKRLAARRGSNRAAIVVGHSILVIVYHILKNISHIMNLEQIFLKKKIDAVKQNAIKKLEMLGYKVTLTEVA